jgi:hypothetical protein
MARTDWTREEVILAMDLYVRVGALNSGSIPGAETAEIMQFSGLLQDLGAYPPELRGDKYRNPNSVYLKLMNLRAVETGGGHAMTHGSSMDAAVWRDFIDDRPRLQAEAGRIRAGLRDGEVRPAANRPVIEDVDIEWQHTEVYIVSHSNEPRTAERAEQKLVLQYREYMAAKGIAVRRKRYFPSGEVRPLYSDIWVEARNALIEAKNSDSREALRQAIGQLYDYRRFHESSVRLAVLLPYKAIGDRLDLLQSAGVETVWPYGSGFRDSAHGAFV